MLQKNGWIVDGSCKKEKKNMVAAVGRPVRNVAEMLRREADLH